MWLKGYIKSKIRRLVLFLIDDDEYWLMQKILFTRRSRRGIQSKHVYFEFGVYSGDSLITYISALKKYCSRTKESIEDFHIVAFDSFEGLPAPQDGDYIATWTKGAFPAEIEKVKERVVNTGFPENNITFVPGFFEDSLTDELKDKFLNESLEPSIVLIDCDFYSSTKTVLEWLRPLLLSGTVFKFHDLWSFNGHPEMGELRALEEFNKQNNGYLRNRSWFPQGASGQGDLTYIFSAKEWEFGPESPLIKTQYYKDNHSKDLPTGL